VDNFDDVVRGKGRGIILQLSGPPGVGKTLTAESVAEVMKVPLYAMSAGDLGTHADAVEHSLKNILRMVPKWGAVLLLDEADVFMETRSSTDLERNELVSIFLRMLEYYEGILFLTTNRAEQIDPAFESRIHLSLNYKELDSTSRRHVWRQFLGRSPNTTAFSDEQLDQLAVPQLNGRQIKNTIKTASLLAWSQQKELGFQHIQVVLKLRNINVLKAN
jgi:AAA+ superfamily predicted ATPase